MSIKLSDKSIKFQRFILNWVFGRLYLLVSLLDYGLQNRIEFLGFEIYWGRAYVGENGIMQRTARKRLYESTAKIKQWVKLNRPLRGM